MPRARDPNRKRAFEIYKENGGNIDLIEIAGQLNISAGTVRGWKSKDNWEGQLNGTLRKKNTERSKKKGAQPGNKNSAGGPPGNKKAEKYGFFSKYLPEETREIFSAIEEADPLDLLWHQIQLAYAAIIRAQKIAYVKDQEDKTVEKVEEKKGKIMGEKWEVQQAWDKQNEFLKAQARAQGELRSLIKQYDEMLHKNWDMATEEQRARIENVRAKTEQIKGSGQDETEDKVMKLFEAIGGALDAES